MLLLFHSMAISNKDIEYLREKINQSVRPLFLFDDDADGLCSFLLLYRMVGEGKGIIVKTSPELTIKYLPMVNEYSPDLVVILDKPMVEQEFLDKIQVPVIWLDHHEPIKRHNVEYFNPRIKNDKDNRPTSYWAYKIAEQDLWIATVGCIADWYIPPFAKEFSKKYPDILKTVPKDPAKALFSTRFGELAQAFNFILKGKTKESLACVKILTRIKSPYEILDKTTAQGKYIYSKYKTGKKEYDNILSEVRPPKGDLLVHTYSADRTSYTAQLSNELMARYPKKTLIICREKSGEMRCSIRSKKYAIPPKLEKALQDVRGYGGGHTHACGACIKAEDFSKFVKNFEEILSKSRK